MPAAGVVKAFEAGVGSTLGHIALVVGLGTMPRRLMVESGGATTERALPCRGTLRYPRLERVAGVPDGLTALARAR